jgi:hypothetical protein
MLLLCRIAVQNLVVGAPCGIMDQLTAGSPCCAVVIIIVESYTLMYGYAAAVPHRCAEPGGWCPLRRHGPAYC